LSAGSISEIPHSFLEKVARTMYRAKSFIVNPAGSGKTKLAVSYFDSHKLPGLW
jgi:hypothetical protein